MHESKPNFDQLWKDVITELFEEFLLFFSPDLYEQVDFTTSPQFLEQELQTIFPDSESNKRVADKLVKLQLKNGQEQWVFIHIEVQGGYEKVFPKRMFQYFYRIMDMYDQQVFALALLTDEKSKYNLNEYLYDFFGTKISYSYNTYRIASQSETALLQSNNPFALAVLAGLYVSKSKKDASLKFNYKRKLLRLLLQDTIRNKEVKREYIQKLLIFIDHILSLPEEEEIILIHELKPLIETEGKNMGLSLGDTSFARYFRKEGFEEGKVEGKEEGEKQKAIEIAKNLLKMNLSAEAICEATGLTLEEVKELKNNKS